MADKDKKGFAKGLTNYGDPAFSLYLRRSFAKSMGYSSEMLSRPVVGIADSKSGFNNCHRHFPELIEAVKRGVLAAGALPIEFPTVSLGEVFLSPTSMMFRNLMSIDVEEMIRAQPMNAVVLVGGCDKTVPAQLMGALSADLPAVQLLAGPMMPTSFQGERLGACTDCRRFWAMHRAGKVSSEEIEIIEGNLATTAGTCAVMGTASTMASITEALGMALPNTGAIPAVHADRLRAAEESGRRAAQLALSPIRPSEIVTPKAVENALRVLLATGGSTNAIVHLTAIAGRVGYQDRLEEAERTVGLDAGAHRSEAHRPVLHVRPLRRRRRDGRAARARAAPAPRLHDGCRHHARRGDQAPPTLCRSGGGEAAGRAAGEAGRPGGAVRFARAQRRHPEAIGGRRESLRERRPRRRSSPRSTISPRASTMRTWTSSPTTSSCCRTPARSPATRCPKQAICRSRRSWRRQA
jgi:hypothetical protein